MPYAISREMPPHVPVPTQQDAVEGLNCCSGHVADFHCGPRLTWLCCLAHAWCTAAQDKVSLTILRPILDFGSCGMICDLIFDWQFNKQRSGSGMSDNVLHCESLVAPWFSRQPTTYGQTIPSSSTGCRSPLIPCSRSIQIFPQLVAAAELEW